MKPPGTEPSGPVRYRLREGYVLAVDDSTSARMARVRQRGTRPELVVRAVLTRHGARYRLKNRDLPGSPDIANRRQRWAVFVHGCFWHCHGCKASTTPRRNASYWQQKLDRNRERDAQVIDRLQSLGFTVAVIWECETRQGQAVVLERLRSSLHLVTLHRDSPALGDPIAGSTGSGRSPRPRSR